MSTIEIDGSTGEGGGQIVRTALALSCVLGRPLQLFNIRCNRKYPGLAQQQLGSITALQDICRAHVTGNYLGSSVLRFHPQQISTGVHEIRIHGPGSAPLAVQTVLPALMIQTQPTTLFVSGGTHAISSPPVDAFEAVYAPLLSLFGPSLSIHNVVPGYFPHGNGQFTVQVTPAALDGVTLVDRGEVRNTQRYADQSAATVIVNSDSSVAMFNGFISRTQTKDMAKQVAQQQADRYLNSDAAVDFNRADQLLLPAAIAANVYGQSSTFTTDQLTEHTLTHISLLKHFIGVQITTEKQQGRYKITVEP